MQVGSDQLKSQQEIMSIRGFYKGAIDGIWGPKTIEAKQKWERSGKFAPGIPNNGLPLGERGPFPAGIRRDAKSGLLTCPELDTRNRTQSTETIVIEETVAGAASSIDTVPQGFKKK